MQQTQKYNVNSNQWIIKGASQQISHQIYLKNYIFNINELKNPNIYILKTWIFFSIFFDTELFFSRKF